MKHLYVDYLNYSIKWQRLFPIAPEAVMQMTGASPDEVIGYLNHGVSVLRGVNKLNVKWEEQALSTDVVYRRQEDVFNRRTPINGIVGINLHDREWFVVRYQD